MNVIAVIERAEVIRRILAHLGLPPITPSFRVPPGPRESPAAERPHEWSYEPCFGDLPVADPVIG